MLVSVKCDENEGLNEQSSGKRKEQNLEEHKLHWVEKDVEKGQAIKSHWIQKREVLGRRLLSGAKYFRSTGKRKSKNAEIWQWRCW